LGYGSAYNRLRVQQSKRGKKAASTYPVKIKKYLTGSRQDNSDYQMINQILRQKKSKETRNDFSRIQTI
jgi:hypothetical protein